MAGLAAWLVVVLASIALAAAPAASPSPVRAEAVAADDTLPDDSIRFLNLDTASGLSQATVLTVAQDRYGFIWLGTSDGLNRYDGHDTRIFRRGEQGLSRDSVHSLCTDAHDSIWVGLFDGGVHRYDSSTGRIGPLRPPGTDHSGPLPGRVHACLADDADRVWFASDTGLSRYDYRTDRFDYWPLANAQDIESAHRVTGLARHPDGSLLALSPLGLFRLVDNALELEPASVTLAARSALSAFRVDGDAVLLATRSAGLWRWLPATGELQPVPLPRFAEMPELTALLRDRDGRLWLGTDNLGVLYR